VDQAGVWPLAGRDAELDAIGDALACGGGVMLVGAAGVGKTRLLRESLARWARAGGECELVVATRAASSIPFGAVSHLIPHGAPAPTALALLGQVAQRFETHREMVLGVDDAHLLDEASAALLHQLAAHGLVRPVVTVRLGESVSDAVTALWKDSGRRFEVRPLSTTALDQLLDHAVPGRLDPISRRRLNRLAGGNPLLLRELLADGMETGALQERGGVWRWRGMTSAGTRLVSLVAARFGALEPRVREVLETVACGEPLPLSTLERITEPSAIAAAERGGVAVVEHSGARALMRLAHPLYGEVLRDSLPASRARAIYGRLAAELVTGPMRRSDDALVAGVWQIHAGSIKHPEVVMAAARQAVARFDLDLAERLARAARTHGYGWDADWLLARILQYQSRNQDALDALPSAPPPGDTKLARWAITRAGILYWGLGRTADAEQALIDIPDTTPGWHLGEATRSWILLYDGRCGAALQVAQDVMRRPEASDRAVVWAGMGGSAAAGLLGRLDLAASIAATARTVLARHSGQLPWGDAQIGYGLCYALRAVGHLREARKLADGGYREAVATDAGGMAAVWAGFRGVIAKAQGCITDAQLFLREAIALVADNDQYQIVRVCMAELAGAAALAGDHRVAKQWLTQADTQLRVSNRIYNAWVELDRAWVHAAAGELAAATDTARHAAQLARDTEQPTFEVIALYDVARLGAPATVQARLKELAGRVEGDFAGACARAAAALAARDADALEQTTTRFADHGHLLLAAETATAAAHRHNESGRRDRARESAASAAILAAQCHEARTPLLSLAGLTATLTPRERQVATLAATMRSQQIADQLGISVHTVNNTLARVYTKLGANRRQLATVLSLRPNGPPPHHHVE
jgi:DNA-binding CsgD family transcriptional regulator